MKKLSFISIAVLLVAAFVVTPAFAKPSVIKGEVQTINTGDNTITVLTQKGDTITVVAPTGFDLSTLVIGDQVVVKGTLQNDGSILADWIIKADVSGSETEDTAEGSKAIDSAYCAAGKQTSPHPMATALAAKYGVTTEWVMGYFCDGYGMGAIMLALKTHELTGASADDLLAQRAGGMGWGAIWQGLKLIGNERNVQTPPGLLNKPNHP